MKLKFVDEYVVEDSLQFKNSFVGGLSGVDFDGENYYFVVDDSKDPRVFKVRINLKKDTINSVDFIDVIYLKDSSEFYKQNSLDLESILFDKENKQFNFVSEGSIYKGKNPSVFKTNLQGNFVMNYEIPEYFNANSTSKPKHNATFESSSKSFDNKGFWVGMEGVLESDGEEATFTKTNSPIRITYFSTSTAKAEKQFAYQLDSIGNPPKGDVNLNGVTAILEYAKNQFFVVERAYQNNYGSYGNTIKIYKATLEKKTTNTLESSSLKNIKFILVKKELLLNFNDVRNQLTDGIVDNIEGITLGPKLSNGNQTLLLVSDDNFQMYGKQLNQLILLEIIE
ncbi:esterase-like activity of phytase family protein [Tenacibaculum adriaticum]|nr:esterase-like activity of phytase family protein [Tenacibaculum adriaticum]